LFISDLTKSPEQVLAFRFENQGVVGVFELDNVTNRRLVLMKSGDSESQESNFGVDVFVHSPNPIFPRTDDWSFQLSLEGIKSRINYAFLDSDYLFGYHINNDWFGYA